MGVSFSYYRKPVVGGNLPIRPRSRFLREMIDRFGNYPWTLNVGSIPQLQEVRTAMDDTSVDKAVNALIEVLLRGDDVIVEAEF